MTAKPEAAQGPYRVERTERTEIMEQFDVIHDEGGEPIAEGHTFGDEGDAEYWSDALNAAFAAGRAEGEALAVALERVMEQWRRPDENASAYFERQAERFYKATGMLPPGKSEPLEMASVNRDEERRAAWESFVNEPYNAARAALARWRQSNDGGGR